MATDTDKHGPQTDVTVTSTPTLVVGPPHRRGRRYTLIVNESAGPIFVTTDITATNGPKVGTVVEASDGVPAGTFSTAQNVYLVADASTAVSYSWILIST